MGASIRSLSIRSVEVAEDAAAAAAAAAAPRLRLVVDNARRVA